MIIIFWLFRTLEFNDGNTVDFVCPKGGKNPCEKEKNKTPACSSPDGERSNQYIPTDFDSDCNPICKSGDKMFCITATKEQIDEYFKKQIAATQSDIISQLKALDEAKAQEEAEDKKSILDAVRKFSGEVDTLENEIFEELEDLTGCPICAHCPF